MKTSFVFFLSVFGIDEVKDSVKEDYYDNENITRVLSFVNTNNEAVAFSKQGETKYHSNYLELSRTFHYNAIENEASQYPEGYKGFEIRAVSGRKTFDYSGIPEWNEAKQKLKDCEGKYKSMFEAKAKGLNYANVSEEGEELPLPEIKYGKSYLTVKAKR